MFYLDESITIFETRFGPIITQSRLVENVICVKNYINQTLKITRSDHICVIIYSQNHICGFSVQI